MGGGGGGGSGQGNRGVAWPRDGWSHPHGQSRGGQATPMAKGVVRPPPKAQKKKKKKKRSMGFGLLGVAGPPLRAWGWIRPPPTAGLGVVEPPPWPKGWSGNPQKPKKKKKTNKKQSMGFDLLGVAGPPPLP
jgi:hypothetical protein